MNSIARDLRFAKTKKVYETLSKMCSKVHSSLEHIEVYDYKAHDFHQSLENIGSRKRCVILLYMPTSILDSCLTNPMRKKCFLLGGNSSKRGS